LVPIEDAFEHSNNPLGFQKVILAILSVSRHSLKELISLFMGHSAAITLQPICAMQHITAHATSFILTDTQERHHATQTVLKIPFDFPDLSRLVWLQVLTTRL
jgi:hypothetical protein